MPTRSDLRDALAYVFRREGGDPIPAEELGNRVSFDLRWFSPGEARAFVQHAQASGLVEETGDGLVPAFDVDEVDLPVTFSPDLDLDPVDGDRGAGGSDEEEGDGEAGQVDAPAGADAGDGDLVGEVVAAVAEATDASRADVEGRVAAVRDRFGGLVADEAAALVVAREAGLDVGEWAGEASEGARARLPEPPG